MTALRILVVDDHQDSADTLALLLGLMGHEAITAYDGARALALAAGIFSWRRNRAEGLHAHDLGLDAPAMHGASDPAPGVPGDPAPGAASSIATPSGGHRRRRRPSSATPDED